MTAWGSMATGDMATATGSRATGGTTTRQNEGNGRHDDVARRRRRAFPKGVEIQDDLALQKEYV
jgi:hypothetical protein